jgi:hypothetical protein
LKLLQWRGFTEGIVILTTRHVMTPGTPRSICSSLERVGNYRLRRFTGAYDLLGHQIVTEGQLTFDSISRFKGQEAPAVILVVSTRHWRDGLSALVVEVRRRGIRSIAIPALGAGLGGLDWADVRPRIERAMRELPEVSVVVFEPHEAP